MASNRKVRALTPEEIARAVRLFDALERRDTGAIAFEAVDLIVSNNPEYRDAAPVATIVLRRALDREDGLLARFGSWLGSWFR